MKKGKSKDTAVLRTMINADAQNFATRRLLRDLDQIRKETIPTVGVTAQPLEHDLFIWHANIRGPKDSQYEGGVFHLELTIPESYPHQPPQVKLFTDLPHPNVFDKKVCLDMLEPSKGQDGTGWSSAYTIQSVLLQLQSFLFEEIISEQDQQKTKAQIQKAVLAANQYKCTTQNCKHGGKLSAFPPFNVNETNEDFFIMKESETQLFEKELLCFHTKLPFRSDASSKESQSKRKFESCLGILLNVSKIPRSGQVKQALPSHDYISIKAFLNEGIKWDSLNANYTHWLPLYFGATDNQERVIHLCERAISMIMTNHTRRFNPEMVLEVFPKITQTIVFQIMDEKTHASIRYLRLLTHVHSLWLLMMEQNPRLYELVEETLQNFIKDEKFRHKDNTPNLGILLNLLYVAPKTKFHDVILTYALEQLDRQVFWLLKEIPELADEKLVDKIEPKQRVQISFKQQLTSFQMGCFQLSYLDLVKKPFATNKDLLTHFAKNFSKLPSDVENSIQQRVFRIFKQIVDYDTFYDFIGVKKRTIEEMDNLLKQAVINSKTRKYHGTLDEMNELPKTEVQINNFNKSLNQLEDVFKVTQSKQGKQVEVKVEVLKENPDWRTLCSERWQWIADEIYWNESVTATQLTEQANNTQFFGQQIKDRLYGTYVNGLRDGNTKFEVGKIVTPPQTWQSLYQKLDLEEFLRLIDFNPDFQALYGKIHLAKNVVTDLAVPLRTVNKLSSGYHFLTGLLEGITSVVNLYLVGQYPNQNSLPKKTFKAIYKGLNNLSTKPNALARIGVFNLAGTNNEQIDMLFSPLGKFSNALRSIEFQNSNVLSLANGGKSLGGLITSLKSLHELRLRGAIQSQVIAKEISDGLMRAKQVQFVDISNNNQITDKGLSQIIYNLAFSPKLTHLNISGSSVANYTEVVESLYKLLRITGSLEVLEMRDLNNAFNSKLVKEFWVSLGEIKTLRVLDLCNSGVFEVTQCDHAGKAIAFNARRGGILQTFLARGAFDNYSKIEALLNALSVSDQEHEFWYGDQIKANKMSGNELQKVFYCGLNSLTFTQGPAISSSFSLSRFKAQYKPKEPIFVSTIQKANTIDTLLLQGRNLKKSEAELLYLTLDPTRNNLHGNIKYLNLARNDLQKEGAKVIAQLLEVNQTVQHLELSGNKIGVSGGKAIGLALVKNRTLKSLNVFNNKIGFDGAKAFGQAFAVNNVLEFVEFGHNRIRNKGLLAIAEGIRANEASVVKILGLRFNFLTEEGIIDLLRLTTKSHLRELFIKNNNINEYGLFALKKFYDEQSIHVKVDLFQKLTYLPEQRLERTIWTHPYIDPIQLQEFFQRTHDAGIVVDVRSRKGPKYPNRDQNNNRFNLVEFADKNSLTRAMALASRRKTCIGGITFRVFKAGTGTFQYQKKSAKQKKAETSKTNVLPATGGYRGERPPARGGPHRGRGAPRGRRG